MPNLVATFGAKFPRLSATNCREASPVDINYNCIAFAAGVNDAWWEPDPFYQYFWPVTIEREYTIVAYVKAFGANGYSPTPDLAFEPGCCKVAVYAIGGRATHAARQIGNDWWASKLGQNIDVEHATHALTGGDYGEIVCVLSKPGANLRAWDVPGA